MQHKKQSPLAFVLFWMGRSVSFARLLRVFGWAALCLMLSIAPAKAEDPKTLQQHFLQTQEALAIGEMKAFTQSLEKMEKTYLATESKLKEGEREQFQLWLYRFQFKRYQMEADPPPIRNIESFESIEAINQYIKRFEGSLGKLQKALEALRRYNQLYNKIALTQRVQAQIRLQASLSTERDIELLTRQGQVYVALLRFAQSQWSDKKALKQRLKNQDSTISTLREQQQRVTIEQSAIRREQRNLVSKVKEAHLLFTDEQKALIDRTNNARTLFIVGGILTAVGAGIAITGGIFVHDNAAKNPYATYNCESMPNGTELEKNLRVQCEVQRALPNPIITPPQDDAGQRSLKSFYGWGGPTFIATGAVIGGTGIALLIAGLIIIPRKDAQINAVLRSQERFLKEQSSISSGSAWPLMQLHAPSPQRATSLGIFQ